MSLKRILSFAAALAVIIFMTVSCNTDYPGFKKTSTGMYYKIYSSNDDDTTRVRTGSIVTIYLKYGLKDTAFFDSKDFPQEVILPVMESQYEGDFYDGLRLLKRGDSATFILKAGPLFHKTFNQPQLPPDITEESDFYFDVAIYKVQTQEELDKEAEIENMELEKEEMAKLEQYITVNQINVQPDASGIYYIEKKKGNGKSPDENSYVSVHYTVNLLGGEQLFSTLERGEPMEVKFGSQFENPGFMEVLGKMKEGGKANAIIPSAKAFGAKGAGSVVPPFSTLYYDIELVKITPKEVFEAKQAKDQAEKQAQQKADSEKRQKEEEPAREKYLKDNNIVPTTILPSGLIYVEKQAGKGTKAVNGKKVKVHYTGKLLDGSVFDSSVQSGQPYEFTLGKNEVIQGWDLGIALMNQGGKATLIIPSELAYGDKGAGQVIPPYSTLVFDVELVEVEK